MERCIVRRGLAAPDAPVLLMVSGGSDSTALAYLASDLRDRGVLGPLGILHVNHRLRGAAADADAAFVARLAELLGIPLFARSVDVGALAVDEGGNVEAVARRERYRAADEALVQLCRRASSPVVDGCIFTAHTADDRVESFYMRSIVGTGPGGFRAMRYRNGRVCRPLLEAGREELRSCLRERAEAGLPVVRDEEGALWREDATNAHTDRFRAYVRHEIVPRAKERNPRLLETLARTMDLIADEDDMLEAQAGALVESSVAWLGEDGAAGAGGPEGSADMGVAAGAAAGFPDDGGSASVKGEAARVKGFSGAAGGCAIGGAADACVCGVADAGAPDAGKAAVRSELSACVLAPSFGQAPRPLARRAVANVLQRLLGVDARVEAASVEAVLAAFDAEGGAVEGAAPADARGAVSAAASDAPLASIGAPRSGYVTNIQGNLAVSSNKRGVRIEPMSAFRARRKRK